LFDHNCGKTGAKLSFSVNCFNMNALVEKDFLPLIIDDFLLAFPDLMTEINRVIKNYENARNPYPVCITKKCI